MQGGRGVVLARGTGFSVQTDVTPPTATGCVIISSLFFAPKWLRVEHSIAVALKSNGSGLKDGWQGGAALTLHLVTCLHFRKTSHDMSVDDVESVFEFDGGALGSR